VFFEHRKRARWRVSMAPVQAHEVRHRGTVATVEAARLQVKIVDAKTKKEDWRRITARIEPVVVFPP
jgi:hypothetical protein